MYNKSITHMERIEKEHYIAPTMLVVEVNVGRAVCIVSKPGYDSEPW